MVSDDIGRRSVEERRSKLYGPGRVVAQQKYKDFCTKDSVHDALEKVACYCDDSDWLSNCKRSYVVSAYILILLCYFDTMIS